MAKAVTSKTESLTVRVPVEVMAELRAEAAGAGTSVGSVVVGKARGGKSELIPDLGPVVYFLRAGEDGPVKIGWSTKLSSRIGSIQTGSPVKLNLIRTVAREPWCEGWFHDQFGEQRLEGEWFEFDQRMLTLDPPEKPPPIEPKLRQYSGKLKLRSIKVPDEMWHRWHVEAKAKGMSLTALIIQSMEGDARADAVPVLHRQIEELNETGDAMRKAITSKDAEIAELRAECEADLKALTDAKDKWVTAGATLEEATATLKDRQAEITRLRARVAELEKALAVKPGSAVAAKSAIASLRYDPKMKAVEPTADGKGLVAAVLPVTGTEFPARPVYLRGQDPAKGKGKR